MKPGPNLLRAMRRRERPTNLPGHLAEALHHVENTLAAESVALQDVIGLGMRDATAEEVAEACAAWERNGGHL
jgi:hypothetical protein